MTKLGKPIRILKLRVDPVPMAKEQEMSRLWQEHSKLTRFIHNRIIMPIYRGVSQRGQFTYRSSRL